jgi:hypothetical protein
LWLPLLGRAATAARGPQGAPLRDGGRRGHFPENQDTRLGITAPFTTITPSHPQRRVDSRRHPGSLKGAFRRHTDGGAGSGACARDLSPRSRATSGPRPWALRPAWPTRASKKPRLERREASARRIWARNASLGVPACRVKARQGAAIRTERLSALHPLMARGEGKECKAGSTRSHRDRRNGAALVI